MTILQPKPIQEPEPELQSYVVDVCAPIQRQDGTWGVQMKSWVVRTKNPTEAIQEYVEEGSDELYYEGDVVNFIIIGLQPI